MAATDVVNSGSSGVMPIFSSPSDEIEYWRGKCLLLEGECRQSREELEEFQQGSRELEQELETQLEQAERCNKEVKSLANRLQMENDILHDKLDLSNRELNYRVAELQKELSDMSSIKDELSSYIRQLELQNDDLERAKRSTLASLEDFDSRMNEMIERNAFLESELDEKESLKVSLQRMKDETRDLKSDINLLGTTAVAGAAANAVEIPPLQRNSTPPSTPIGQHSSPLLLTSSPLTSSSRISALNIVSDLLRKVGALELKLVSCRNIVKENHSGVRMALVTPSIGDAKSNYSSTPSLSDGTDPPVSRRFSKRVNGSPVLRKVLLENSL